MNNELAKLGLQIIQAATTAEAGGAPADTKILTAAPVQIAVLERGFVYVGAARIEGGALVIEKAQNVRRWGTARGLGELAAAGPQPNTKLDPAGTVRAPLSAVIHLIDCEPSKWTL